MSAIPAKILEGQIRQNLGRVVYTHKAHEKCADQFFEAHGWTKSCQIVLSALTTAGFFVTLFGDNRVTSILGAIVSTALLAINSYTKDFDFGKLAEQHKETAAGIWLLRERYFSLLTDLRAGVLDEAQAASMRDELDRALSDIYAQAPRTTKKSYERAQKALKVSEDMTFSDSEIDAFLPEVIRFNKNAN